MSRRASDLWNDNQVTIDVGDVIMGNVSVIGPVSLAGNVTISDSKGFIGCVSVSHAAWADPKTYLGLVTVGGIGTVTLSDPKGYIGLVTIGGIGTVTLSDPKGYIGLVSTNGNVNLSTLISGEDQTNDVMKVEQQFSYKSYTSNSTEAIKSASGYVHTVTIGGISSPTITLWDNTLPNGTYIHRFFAGIPINTYVLDSKFTTGLTIDVNAGASPQVHISYR